MEQASALSPIVLKHLSIPLYHTSSQRFPQKSCGPTQYTQNPLCISAIAAKGLHLPIKEILTKGFQFPIITVVLSRFNLNESELNF